MNDLPESVRPLFLEGGWQAGRQVAVSSEIPARHLAFSVLAEFGGLRIGHSGPGENVRPPTLHSKHFIKKTQQLLSGPNCSERTLLVSHMFNMRIANCTSVLMVDGLN